MTRVLPILEDGELKEDATFLVLGCMFYPEDERAAHQLAGLLGQEYHAAEAGEKSPSALANEVFSKLRADHLCLVGEMALIVSQNIRELGVPNIGKAAHVVSENHSTNTTRDGRPLPTTQSVLRSNFGKYSAVRHLWAASWLDELTGEHSALPRFLAISDMFLREFRKAEFAPPYDPWIIPCFRGLERCEWPDGGLIENPEVLDEYLKSYVSRSGR